MIRKIPTVSRRFHPVAAGAAISALVIGLVATIIASGWLQK
ncbi:MAG: hypothetical protein ACEQSK_01890 [Sphingomonadaceae bacterium]